MAYFVLWLRQKGVNGFYCGVASAFIAIFPLFPYYAVAMWKDTYFALALFLFALYHIDMVCSQMETLCFWSPTRDGYTAYVRHGGWANNIGLVQTNLWYNWFGWDFSQLVYPRYCISSGLFFWVYMFSTMVGYSAVPKKQRFKALLPAMPTIGLWLTIMIATPVASSLRYVYVLVLLTPLLVVFPALMRRKLADAPDHKPE